MATSGSPWIIDKQDIIDTIKRRKGVLRHVAKDLNVAPTTLLKKINSDPEIVQLVKDERNAVHEISLDESEETILYAMQNREIDLSNALKSAFFTLNSKGESRGWKNTNANSNTFVFKEIDPTKTKHDQDAS